MSDGSNFNDPFELSYTDKETGILKQVPNLHILCLTNSYQNKLLWSHYTNSHKGICLTVQVPNELVYPICYSKHRLYSDSDLDDIINKSNKKCKKSVEKSFSILTPSKKMAYIKDQKWAYEKEYRIVRDSTEEQGLTYEDGKWFFSVKIINIYLGVNFDRNEKDLKDKILDACVKNGIKVTPMCLAPDSYSVKPSIRRDK